MLAPARDRLPFCGIIVGSRQGYRQKKRPQQLAGLLPCAIVIAIFEITSAFGDRPEVVGARNDEIDPDTRSGRSYFARSDQGRHLSSLKSASRLAKGLTAAGVGIASTAIIGLYWN
ncbi:hypothetical protein SAMN05443247_06394 [Bradyrhizobium erythrophlei]|nr:hypothetical protein SAMN05443247_06394 [Bradyrhizobium erythrophlei]